MTVHTALEKDDLIEQLRACYAKNGSIAPSTFNEDDEFTSAAAISREFGTWGDGLEEAGIDDSWEEPTGRQNYSDKELLDQLRECKEREDEVSPKKFNEQEDFVSASSIVRRFGSWADAKELAGIDEDLSKNSGRKEDYSDGEILADIKEVYDREEKVTTELMTKHDDVCGPTVATERFGSWKNAKEAAGLEDGRSSNEGPEKYDEEDYFEMLRNCKEKHGKVTQRLFEQDDEFASAGAVTARFEDWDVAKLDGAQDIPESASGWSKAKVLAGVAGDESSQQEYTDEELLDMLRECKEKHGKCTAQVFASDDDYCSPETIQRRFGSWSTAKDEADL
jgi:hypothetical protein